MAMLATFLSAGVTAETPRPADAHQERFEFVQRLLEDSSGARQVNQSSNPHAKTQHEHAKALRREAVAAGQAGDTVRADRLLEQAIKSMFEAIRLAESAQVTSAKKQRDFDQRAESVTALLAAHDRICQEKRCEKRQVDELHRQIDGKMTAARNRRDDGNDDVARVLLDEAYVSAKVAIERLRGGDTLVRTLSFRNKEEEYRYELDRNDTHRMLVKILLEEKMRDSAVEDKVRPLVERSASLRIEAERQAGRREYHMAVKSLESSTRELVLAIRGAGVYIPE
ncbi:MAG TPA: hypothetical protein VLG93_05435 [Sulfuricaulis sp.]|nr:hypothetical protein [Sulfuricaulis sp.]